MFAMFPQSTASKYKLLCKATQCKFYVWGKPLDIDLDYITETPSCLRNAFLSSVLSTTRSLIRQFPRLKAEPLVPSAVGRSSLEAHPENDLPATKNENKVAVGGGKRKGWGSWGPMLSETLIVWWSGKGTQIGHGHLKCANNKMNTISDACWGSAFNFLSRRCELSIECFTMLLIALVQDHLPTNAQIPHDPTTTANSQ